MLSRGALLFTLLSLVACRGPRAADDDGRGFSVVFLDTGPRSAELTAEESQEASRGHLETIKRLSNEGVLLLAGAFEQPRAHPDQRGVFILAEADAAEAQAIAATDPAVAAGALAVRVCPWQSQADLALVRRREQERKARSEVFRGRTYVLGTGRPAGAAAEALEPLDAQGRVVFSGDLGGPCAGEHLVVLAARSPEEARDWLSASPGADEVEWELSAWYATEFLMDLAAGTGKRAR